jgi:methylphosphotriester-DNA--protein-cysteine methyltransferase
MQGDAFLHLFNIDCNAPQQRFRDRLSLGFNDLSHFNKAFRARLGMSPGRWRSAAEVAHANLQFLQRPSSITC